jgi:hypothetical protein
MLGTWREQLGMQQDLPARLLGKLPRPPAWLSKLSESLFWSQRMAFVEEQQIYHLRCMSRQRCLLLLMH